VGVVVYDARIIEIDSLSSSGINATPQHDATA